MDCGWMRWRRRWVGVCERRKSNKGLFDGAAFDEAIYFTSASIVLGVIPSGLEFQLRL